MVRGSATIGSICVLLLLGGAAPAPEALPAHGAGNAAVHQIELPRFQSILPDGPGRDAFASACLTCHSTTYITMQPPLTAAKWEEVVVKMTKTYAAPIPAEQVPHIV